jgi:hypothetical protein
MSEIPQPQGMKFIGWQYRRKQSFIELYPNASEFAMTIYKDEREARIASLSTREMDSVTGRFPQNLIDAAILRPLFVIDTGDAPTPLTLS